MVFRQPGAPEATLRLLAHDGTRALERAGEGLIRVRLAAPGALRTRARFERADGERFLGFGERSDAVVREAGEVQHRVTEGPYQDVEEPFLTAFVPAPGYNTRLDATYFPVPWLMSTRGYGVLVEDDPTSVHRLGSPWEIDIEGGTLTLLVVAGPTPRAVLRRFSAHVGRQPPAPREALGPWWQPPPGIPDEQVVSRLRAEGALGSVVATFLHYLPCADHVERGDAERRRVAALEAAGLMVTTYFNPMICTDHPRFDEAAGAGLLTKTAAGTPYLYRYTGSSVFLVGQLDFRAPGTPGFFGELLGEALAAGHDGWMEDFGEYTPDDAVAADGATGSAGHNAYVRDYHAAAHALTAQRPMLRYVRSGWTGSARSSPIVWGGDPTTSWGYDGLESAVRNGLSMGLSGVSRWGSDIGGFFALSEQQTSPELLKRWIQMGFASGVMRTQANGFDLDGSVNGRRSQITDADVLPVWGRYARLRTRLLPYLERAERQYDRSGLPVMRQLALAYPRDGAAVAREDEWLLGDDLLAAPVLRPGETRRTLYLPKGRWYDLWRSADPDLRRLRRPVSLRGGREVELDAPLDELPLLARDGARIELLPAGARTWREAVAAGRTRRTLLAFGGRRLRLRGSRRYAIQWAMRRRPATVLVDGRRRAFTYSRGVVRLRRVRAPARIAARPRARRAARPAAAG